MDKNNDIQVNKVDKWCEGVADVSLLQAKKSVDMFLCCYSPMLSVEALDAVRTIYVYLDEALDRFNELEAKHNADCGLISKLEEENRDLESKLDSVTSERNHAEYNSLVDRMAKKHYEEQSFRLRNTVRNYGEQIRCFKNDISELKAEIYKLEEDKEGSEFCNDSLLKALNQAGIRPSFDIRANKWIIQYTDKAENAFLAADQIKRNAEKRVEAADNKIKELEKKLKSAEDGCEVYRNSYERTVDDVRKLLEFLKKYGVPVKYRNDVNTWYLDFENNSFNKAWDDTLMKDCKSIDKSCPVACECENFKPKVHHSYDPLDDLPDMEHS